MVRYESQDVRTAIILVDTRRRRRRRRLRRRRRRCRRRRRMWESATIVRVIPEVNTFSSGEISRLVSLNIPAS